MTTIHLDEFSRLKNDRVKFILQWIKVAPRIMTDVLFVWNRGQIPKLFTRQLQGIYDDMKEAADKHNQSQRSSKESKETHESSTGEESTGAENNHNDTDRTSVRRTRSSTARNANHLDASSNKVSDTQK